MKTPYKDFCDKHREKLLLDEDIMANKMDSFDDMRDRVNFGVSVYISTPNVYPMGLGSNGTHLFNLDEDDLKYLYDKYSKKVVEEMKQNIKEIEDSYAKSIVKA